MLIKSLMYVPAKEKTLRKIGHLNTDAYIIDLEDSIENKEKERALERVNNLLDNVDFSQCKIYVRLNLELYSEEMKLLEHYSPIGFVLPKFENTEAYLEGIDVWKRHQVIALIETPLGIVNLPDIVTCDWIDAIAFGAEDYTATTNMKNDLEYLFYQKSRIITYAKAYGKHVYDTPSFHLNDMEQFRKEVQISANMGFDGKQAIIPKHLDYINECFKQYDLGYIKTIVKRYEDAEQATLVIDGTLYEKMHIARFKRIIKESGEK